MTVSFARPRHPYKSYDDWHDLIRLSGYDEIYIDEIPPEGVKDNVYICTPMNGEWENGVQTDARVIHWCLEYWREPPRPVPGVEVWHMDKWQADTYGAKYAPVGSHPDLRPNADSAWHECYDAAYIGYINGVHRRERIRHDLLQRGVKLSPTGAWGDERHRILSNSKAYLHIHQHDDIPAVPGLRMVVAAAYALPVITETCADTGIFGAIYSLNYEDIAENVHYWLNRYPNAPKLLENTGRALHQFLCHDFTFRKSVEAAL